MWCRPIQGDENVKRSTHKAWKITEARWNNLPAKHKVTKKDGSRHALKWIDGVEFRLVPVDIIAS